MCGRDVDETRDRMFLAERVRISRLAGGRKSHSDPWTAPTRQGRPAGQLPAPRVSVMRISTRIFRRGGEETSSKSITLIFSSSNIYIFLSFFPYYSRVSDDGEWEIEKCIAEKRNHRRKTRQYQIKGQELETKINKLHGITPTPTGSWNLSASWVTDFHGDKYGTVKTGRIGCKLLRRVLLLLRGSAARRSERQKRK